MPKALDILIKGHQAKMPNDSSDVIGMYPVWFIFPVTADRGGLGIYRMQSSPAQSQGHGCSPTTWNGTVRHRPKSTLPYTTRTVPNRGCWMSTLGGGGRLHYLFIFLNKEIRQLTSPEICLFSVATCNLHPHWTCIEFSLPGEETH